MNTVYEKSLPYRNNPVPSFNILSSNIFANLIWQRVKQNRTKIIIRTRIINHAKLSYFCFWLSLLAKTIIVIDHIWQVKWAFIILLLVYSMHNETIHICLWVLISCSSCTPTKIFVQANQLARWLVLKHLYLINQINFSHKFSSWLLSIYICIFPNFRQTGKLIFFLFIQSLNAKVNI